MSDAQQVELTATAAFWKALDQLCSQIEADYWDHDFGPHLGPLVKYSGVLGSNFPWLYCDFRAARVTTRELREIEARFHGLVAATQVGRASLESVTLRGRKYPEDDEYRISIEVKLTYVPPPPTPPT